MLSLKGIIILSKSYWYYTSMVVCIIMEMLSLKGIIIHSKSYWCYTSMVVCVYYVLPISNYKVCYRNKNHHNYNMLFPMFEQRQDSRVQNMIAKLPSCQVRDFMCCSCWDLFWLSERLCHTGVTAVGQEVSDFQQL